MTLPSQVVWTTSTAMEAEQTLILAEAGRNPAVDAELRARLIESCNARDFSWAYADEAGIHHQTKGDSLHPTITRSGLITWQQVWERIGRGITADRTAELRAAIEAVDAWTGPHDSGWTDARMRVVDATRAFYRSVPVAQLDLFDLLAVA